MAGKKKAPTLPEQLRQLADAIEEVNKPKIPRTQEEMIAALTQPGAFRRKLHAYRARKAEEEGETDEGGDEGAPVPPPPIKTGRRLR